MAFNLFKKKAVIDPPMRTWAQGWTDYKKHCKSNDLMGSLLMLYLAGIASFAAWTHNGFAVGTDLFFIAANLVIMNLRHGWLRMFKKADDVITARETIANLANGSRFRVLGPEGDIIGEGVMEVSRESFHTHSSMKH